GRHERVQKVKKYSSSEKLEAKLYTNSRGDFYSANPNIETVVGSEQRKKGFYRRFCYRKIVVQVS
uniref:Uncharacterized protein n=1 Tax=Anopheles atroparvus TaxID=41427 RepID=A0AAG5DC55_ANOAO